MSRRSAPSDPRSRCRAATVSDSVVAHPLLVRRCCVGAGVLGRCRRSVESRRASQAPNQTPVLLTNSINCDDDDDDDDDASSCTASCKGHSSQRTFNCQTFQSIIHRFVSECSCIRLIRFLDVMVDGWAIPPTTVPVLAAAARFACSGFPAMPWPVETKYPGACSKARKIEFSDSQLTAGIFSCALYAQTRSYPCQPPLRVAPKLLSFS